MGYEISLNAIKKMNDTVSFKDIQNTLLYLKWKNNPWNFEVNESTGTAPYPTFKKYCIECLNLGYKGEPNEELVEFYSKHAEVNIDFWCSTGYDYLDEFITSNLSEYNDDECYLINDTFLDKADEWAEDQLREYSFTPVTPIKSIRLMEEDSEILKRIDGVVVKEDWSDMTHTIYNDDEECLYYSSDIEACYTFDRFIPALNTAKILYNDNYYVWFQRSY